MANTSKLEFYRFKLNHKDNEFKTFKDFAIGELKGKKSLTDAETTKKCFDHFIKSLNSDFAKNDKLKKELTLIEKKSCNKYLDFKPVVNPANQTISGVINGGPYGRDKIISNPDDRDSSSALSRKNSVLQYFYFLLYIPADHDEGCFIIHSNGNDESITILFRNFVSKVFKSGSYNKAIPEAFCPKSFQDEYMKGAVLKSLTFKNSFVDNIHTSVGVDDDYSEYDIRIEATPRNKHISIEQASKFKDFISEKVFGTKKKETKLDDFDEAKLVAENEVTKAQKVFEWNTKDSEFVPVVYLKGRLNKQNEDGTPDFKELAELCLNYFNDEVLPEIRPDKNVTKIK